MQIKRLFNLLQDVQDILSIFEHVAGTAQMVSCLERMRRGTAPEEFYNTIQSLRVSLTEAFNDQIELGGELSDDGPSEAADNIADSLLEEGNWEAENKDDGLDSDNQQAPAPKPTP